MSIQGIRVRLTPDEIKALEQWAESETRPLSMQAQHIIIEALRQRQSSSPARESQQMAMAVSR